MHDMMKKLLEKKKSEGKTLSPMEKDARMGVVGALKKAAEGAMADKGLKKVTVASDSKEGLEKGLEMAKKVAQKGPEMSEMSEMPESEEHEASESESEESAEHEMGGSEDKEAMLEKLSQLDPEELESLLQIAQKLKG
jgi:uncharacterized membrane protein YvbJ